MAKIVGSAGDIEGSLRRSYEKSHSPLVIPVKLIENGVFTRDIKSHVLLAGSPVNPPTHGLSINCTMKVKVAVDVSPGAADVTNSVNPISVSFEMSLVLMTNVG